MVDFLIRLKGFKKVSPTRCKITFEDEVSELCPFHSAQLQGIKVGKVFLDRTIFILFESKRKYYMCEDYLIQELNLDLKNTIKELEVKK